MAKKTRKATRPKSDLTDRQARVLQLRQEGKSWAAIGRELRTTRGGACSAHKLALEKLGRLQGVREGRQELAPSLREGGDGSEPTRIEQEKLRDFLTDCGLPPRMMAVYVRRLKALAGLPIDVDASLTTQGIVDLLSKAQILALVMLDEFVMAQASAKDLAEIVKSVTVVKQLLKGEPTAIMGYQDRKKLDELAEAIGEELERRKGIIDVTPKKKDAA